MITQDAETIWQHDAGAHRVSVVIPLHNYEGHIVETLDSVATQTMPDLTIIVVDDRSTDGSLEVAAAWMRRNRQSQLGTLLLSHRENAGASISRNTGIAAARSEFCFMLDADNLLYPRCIEKHLAALDARPDAAAAFSLIEVFEGDRDLFGAGVFAKAGLINGNHIDTMALYRRSILLALAGFEKIKYGWEDYDFWLRLLATDAIALHIPEITARYRHHRRSITRTEQKSTNIIELHDEMSRRHPWLELH